MASLPSELWALILTHVPRSDLKSCRLVNQQVLQIASIYLFSKVCMDVTHESFRRAACISESPAFSPYVKRLVYQIDGLQNERYAFRPEWFPHFRRCLKPHVNHLVVDQKHPVSYGVLAGREIVRLTRKQGSEGYELQRILAGFSSLTGIELRCSSKACGAKIMFDDHRWQWPAYDRHPLTGRLLLILLLLVTAPQNSVTSLVCEQLDWDIFERTSSTWIPVCPPLSQLRFLQLHFSMTDGFVNQRSIHNPSAMVTFLNETCQLEALILDFGAYDIFDIPAGAQALGSIILDAIRWPHLKTLSLTGFIFLENELLDFLRGHPSLRNLRISQICLHGGTAASMILGLQKQTRLDKLSFHGIYEDRAYEVDDHGCCITSGNAKNLTHHPRIPPGAHMLGGETRLSCAGYRSEEWFGGDGSWSICKGTPLEEDLASKVDLHYTANE
jgi:hypothetical protein